MDNENDFGNVSITKDAMDLLGEEVLLSLIPLHSSGVYGNVNPEQAMSNDIAAFKRHGSIFSEYTVHGFDVCVMTKYNTPLTVIYIKGQIENEQTQSVVHGLA